MRFFKAPFDVIIMRYYLMITVVIVSFLIGVIPLAIISLPIFLSAILGIKFRKDDSIGEDVVHISHLQLPAQKLQKTS